MGEEVRLFDDEFDGCSDGTHGRGEGRPWLRINGDARVDEGVLDKLMG
jgi:hypothetical protein